MNKKPLLLIVDDEPAILTTFKEALEDEQFLVETLSDGCKVLETIGTLVPDVVFLDIFIPQYNGIQLLERIKKEYPAQKVIMISGFGTIPIAIQAIQKGAADFIEKPLNLDEILEKLVFLKKTNSRENLKPTVLPTYKPETYSMVGASALFCEFMHHAHLIAPLNFPTIIYGNPGSGKSLLARLIHEKSTFASSEFITLSCPTLQSLPSMLNQHHGTIFFKNIHELSYHVQNVLLEYLREEKSHQRIIASSTPRLFEQTRQGQFNQSLFCLLTATPVEIPPINKRRFDIPLLVDHFLHNANQHLKKTLTITPTAIRFLRNYEWTGDVAHIKACIENAVATADTHQTILDHADFYTFLPSRIASYLDEQMYMHFDSLENATQAFQRTYLGHLLKMHRYNTIQLAEFLKIPIAQLHDKITELHINN